MKTVKAILFIILVALALLLGIGVATPAKKTPTTQTSQNIANMTGTRGIWRTIPKTNLAAHVRAKKTVGCEQITLHIQLGTNYAETGYRANPLENPLAIGTMQVRAMNRDKYGKDGNGDGRIDLTNLDDSVFTGVNMLCEFAKLKDTKADNPDKALAAYNAGPASFTNNVPVYTKAYIRKVKAHASALAEALTPTSQGFPKQTLLKNYKNGRIPPAELCQPATAPMTEKLRCEAAADFDRMNEAFKRTFGNYLQLNDGYRDLAGQFAVAGPMAATPGHSKHGLGFALDLGNPRSLTFGSREFNWLTQHARKFKIRHPNFAQNDGSRPEAWHWEWGCRTEDQPRCEAA